jgi:hypothetical protein
MTAAPFKRASTGDDRLDRRWLIGVYLSPVVPFGPALLIFGTSILYYAWRGRYPRRAAALNLHAFIAFAMGVAILVARSILSHQMRHEGGVFV